MSLKLVARYLIHSKAPLLPDFWDRFGIWVAGLRPSTPCRIQAATLVCESP